MHTVEFGTQFSNIWVKYQYRYKFSYNDTSNILDGNNKTIIVSAYFQNYLRLINKRIIIIYGRGYIYYPNNTFGNSKNQFNVYGSTSFPSLQDIRHEFKVVGIYKMKQWTFSADWIFASGKPYTKPSGTYSLPILDESLQNFVTVSEENSARMPAYHRLNIAVSYNYSLFDNVAMGKLNFSVLNIYDHKNIWYKEFHIIDETSVENNINYLGLISNLSFSVKF